MFFFVFTNVSFSNRKLFSASIKCCWLVHRVELHTVGIGSSSKLPSLPPLLHSVSPRVRHNVTVDVCPAGAFVSVGRAAGFFVQPAHSQLQGMQNPFHYPSAVMKAGVFLCMLLEKGSGWYAVVVQPLVTQWSASKSCTILAFQMPPAQSWMAEANTN